MQTRLVQASHCSELSAQSAQIMHSKVLAEREREIERGEGASWLGKQIFVGNVEIEKLSSS